MDMDFQLDGYGWVDGAAKAVLLHIFDLGGSARWQKMQLSKTLPKRLFWQKDNDDGVPLGGVVVRLSSIRSQKPLALTHAANQGGRRQAVHSITKGTRFGNLL